jgi:hypothetical protein
MRAALWMPWLSGICRQWKHAHHYYCADRDCRFSRRTWSGARWRNHNIRLQGSPYCIPECFERAAREFFAEAGTAASSPVRAGHRIPLGLLLLSRGQITAGQLRVALQANDANHDSRLGEYLVKLGLVSESQVMAALGLQWACPVLASVPVPNQGCARLLPYRLLKHFRMMPVHYVAATRILRIAFCDGIDHTALYAIECMLDCRTEACLINRNTMTQALAGAVSGARPIEQMFEGTADPIEMARITVSYAQQMGAREVRVAGCGDYVWVRLVGGREVGDLLFQRSVCTPRSGTVGHRLPAAG